jgi:Carboxypeptidase regulatory-like domain
MTASRIAALAFALSACAALAQEPAQATLTVTVADQSGARIPGARIATTSETTGSRFLTVADAAGQTVVPLEHGTYTLEVRSIGFQSWKETKIDVEENTSRKVTLPISNGDWGPTVVMQVEIPTENQPLDAEIALIPLQRFTLPARRLRGKPHWL